MKCKLKYLVINTTLSIVLFLFRPHGLQKKFIILERDQIQLKGILMHLWLDEVGFISRYFFFPIWFEKKTESKGIFHPSVPKIYYII